MSAEAAECAPACAEVFAAARGRAARITGWAAFPPRGGNYRAEVAVRTVFIYYGRPSLGDSGLPERAEI